MSLDNALDAAQLALSICSLIQQKSCSTKKKDYSTQRHEEILRRQEELHGERVTLGKSVYKDEAIYSLKEHILSLDTDLLINSKESERDMFDQRVQLYETVIFAASVVFGSLSTLIIEGILPNSAANVIIILYSLFSALSFFFLLLCIVICIRVTHDALHFMYKRSHHFNKIVVRPILNEDLTDLLALCLDNQESAEDVSLEYKKHAERVNEKLKEKRVRMSKVYEDFSKSSDFQTSKYLDNLEFWGNIGIFFLNIGTVFLLLAILVLMYAKWGNQYRSVAGAIAAISLILVGIIIFCVLNRIMWPRWSESSRTSDTSSTEYSIEDGAAGQLGNAT